MLVKEILVRRLINEDGIRETVRERNKSSVRGLRALLERAKNNDGQTLLEKTNALGSGGSSERHQRIFLNN